MEEFLNREFFDWVKKTAEIIRRYEGGKITIVHHNDADGICSAALLSKACEYCGFESEFICIEKVYPAIVERIHSEVDGMIIYTDLAGLAAKMIDKINSGRSKVFIIDHHPAKSIDSETVHVLDPELVGISGDIFVSASTLNYIFFRILAGDEAVDYAYLAVIGSVGDYHDRSGGILGLDRFALDEATDYGLVKIKIEGMKERYLIKLFDEYADVIANYFTTLGAVGYGERGYKLAMKACFEGFDEKSLKKAKELNSLRIEKFNEMIEILKGGELKKLRHVQWFHVGERFSPMGVKAVGEFCQQIKDMSFIDDSKYLVGFQNMPYVIPDLGKIDWNVVKMSGRAPTSLERKIFLGEALGLDVLVPKASELVGGFADATHKIAAATVIEKGLEENFVLEFDRLVEEYETSRN
ncbi:phosphoesterase [Archaeoglobales archaeon]|nr:MAG: phosphoesterase [Archaeoglobales archaeon]